MHSVQEINSDFLRKELIYTRLKIVLSYLIFKLRLSRDVSITVPFFYVDISVIMRYVELYLRL